MSDILNGPEKSYRPPEETQVSQTEASVNALKGLVNALNKISTHKQPEALEKTFKE